MPKSNDFRITELKNFFLNSRTTLDLRASSQEAEVLKAAEHLIDSYSHNEIREIERKLFNDGSRKNIAPLLACKLAQSRLFLASHSAKVHCSIVFAVYKEHNRILPHTLHPHGEDFLRRKVAQLNWLLNDLPNFTWNIYVVDDGCPDNSGTIAEQIIETDMLAASVEVLYLQEAINQKLPPAAGLEHTDDSRKGGSIIYGLWHACKNRETSNEEHVLIYTDADLSTHLGQIGLLLNPILNQKKDVAIGSRRETDSVVIKQGGRNDRGKLFIYTWKRMLTKLASLIDTQCGFKAFRADCFKEISLDLFEKKFAFDIELLLKAELRKENSIEKVGIAWIDSEAASTTTDLQPYLAMLKSIAKMYQLYLEATEQADGFAAFVEQINEDEFSRLLSRIPEELTKREPIEFEKYDQVSAAELLAISTSHK